jgi:hypothetical protein
MPGMGEGRTDEPPGEPQTNQRLTVAQAAVSLGITEGAVRSRIKRGTLPTMKEGGTVYVVLGGGTSEANQSTTAADPSSEPSDQSELVESLQDQISYLRDQLEAEREAGRRKDHLLAAALERIPAIEPPLEPREAPETVTGEPTKGAPKEQPYTQEEEGEGGERSWWRRFFGIE